jgi:hypothetical protein
MHARASCGRGYIRQASAAGKVMWAAQKDVRTLCTQRPMLAQQAQRGMSDSDRYRCSEPLTRAELYVCGMLCVCGICLCLSFWR